MFSVFVISFFICSFVKIISTCADESIIISCDDVRNAIDELASHKNATKNQIGVPPPFIILDVSLDNATVFQTRKHIPGAYYFNFKYGTATSEIYPNDIPNATVFENCVRTFGINSDSKIIVYESSPLNDRFAVAGRTWFLFRYYGHYHVSVMDGGLDKWTDMGYPLTNGETPLPDYVGDFIASSEQNQLRIQYEDVLEYVLKANETMAGNSYMKPLIIDPQSPDKYIAGHVPTAISIPLMNFVSNATKSLFPRDKILSQLRSYGLIRSRRPVILTCRSGMKGSGMSWLLAVFQSYNWRIYLGSWIEWSYRQKNQI